jgi:hypothetical protein
MMIYIMGFNGTIVILINSGKPWIFDVSLENDQLIDDKHYDLQNLKLLFNKHWAWENCLP